MCRTDTFFSRFFPRAQKVAHHGRKTLIRCGLNAEIANAKAGGIYRNLCALVF
jgi:hypothetical protein